MVTLLLVIIYICYIGLGIPDSLIGTAWPAIYQEFQLPISYVSIVTMLISFGTVFSSIYAVKVIVKLGTAKVTALSTSLTAIALLGFSCSNHLIWICLCAVPLGIGAGAIDSALNNYVAIHYNGMQMNFLHCFYGIGVSLSPYLMSVALSEDMNWRRGYRIVFFLQMSIAILSIVSLPLWRKVKNIKTTEDEPAKVLSFREMLKNKKILVVCTIFVTSCALESICQNWGSTFLVNTKGLSADTAAAWITLYYVGLTLGRLFSGLFSTRFSAWQINKAGRAVVLVAILLILLPGHYMATILGLFLVGLGNGPIFPNMTHLTPELFGKDVSQSVIGIEMAFSYTSHLLTPILFGIIAQTFGTQFLPVYLLIMFAIMVYATYYLSKHQNR